MAVLRVVLIYVFLMLLFRVAGRRTVGDLSRFDLILLLIISEFIQQAVVAGDSSLTNAVILCSTLVAVDLAFSWLKLHHRGFERLLEGTPQLLVERGELLRDVMRQMRIDEQDILSAARRDGLERLEQIRFAVLETNGHISVIPEAQPRR